MYRKSKIKIIIAAMFSLFIMIEISPREAGAFTRQPEELTGGSYENKRDLIQDILNDFSFLEESPTTFRYAENNPIVGHRPKTGDKEFSAAQWNPSSFLGERDFTFNFIEGDFRHGVFESSERSFRNSEDADDRDDDRHPYKHPHNPSPVSLPSTAILLGTCVAILAGLRRKRMPA